MTKKKKDKVMGGVWMESSQICHTVKTMKTIGRIEEESTGGPRPTCIHIQSIHCQWLLQRNRTNHSNNNELSEVGRQWLNDGCQCEGRLFLWNSAFSMCHISFPSFVLCDSNSRLTLMRCNTAALPMRRIHLNDSVWYFGIIIIDLIFFSGR